MCRHTQLFMGVWVIQTQALMLVWQTLAELPLQPHRNNTLLPSNTLSPTVHTAALNSGSQLRRQKRARETAQEVKELLWKPGNLNWIPGTHVKSQRPWHTPEIPEFLQRDGRQRRELVGNSQTSRPGVQSTLAKTIDEIVLKTRWRDKTDSRNLSSCLQTCAWQV